MTFEAIGREMGISAGRVKQLYDRAMEKVRRAVREDPSLRSVLEEYDVEYEASYQRTPRLEAPKERAAD